MLIKKNYYIFLVICDEIFISDNQTFVEGGDRKNYIFFRPSSHNWQSKICVFYLFVHFYEIDKC